MGRAAYDVYMLSEFGTTPERYVRQFGTTKELIDGLDIEWILDTLDREQLLDDLGLSVCTGYFRAEEKKLYITLNGGDQPQEVPFSYTLEDGVMTWRIDEARLAELADNSGAALEDMKAYLEKMGLWSMVWPRR